MDSRTLASKPRPRDNADRQAVRDSLIEAQCERQELLAAKSQAQTPAARPKQSPVHPVTPPLAIPAPPAKQQTVEADSTPAPSIAVPHTELMPIAKSLLSTAGKLTVVAATNVAEAFLPSRVAETDHDAVLDRLWRRGLVFIAVFFGAMAIWSLATTMSSAVVVPGQFVVDGSSKKVQHPTGGVVGELLVNEGDKVARGDLLIRLDETITRANLQVIVQQLRELEGRRARLEAERDGNDTIEWPDELALHATNPAVARIMAAEEKLFQARRAAREGLRGQLTKRISQSRNEIAGLRAQLEANQREAQIIVAELKGVRELYAKMLTPIMRLNGLERQAVNLDGQRGQLSSSIVQIEGKISETELQIMQIDEDLRAETQKELREVQAKLGELSERRVVAEDQLKRVEIRAPSAGVVHQLAVHTVGGVITPAEPVMLIVPAMNELVLEGKVNPIDRDPLFVGQNVVVRIHTSGRHTMPDLNGTLTRIAADVAKESAAAAPSYTVWMTVVCSDDMRKSITTGMQAEAFIEVGSQSPLAYLLRPLTDQISRAFRER